MVEYVRTRLDFAIDYGPSGVTNVVHAQVIESQVTLGETMGGDSGSPVATEKNGGTLLGMHIAGNSGGLAYVIPAWDILNPGRYIGVSPSDEWELVNP